MSYIIRNKITKQIVRESETPISTHGEIEGLDNTIEIIEVITEDTIDFDSSIEKLEMIEVEEDGVLYRRFTKVALSLSEKNRIAKILTDAELRNQARLRALVGIKAMKNDPIGAILYDQAVGRGEITE